MIELDHFRERPVEVSLNLNQTGAWIPPVLTEEALVVAPVLLHQEL